MGKVWIGAAIALAAAMLLALGVLGLVLLSPRVPLQGEFSRQGATRSATNLDGIPAVWFEGRVRSLRLFGWFPVFVFLACRHVWLPFPLCFQAQC
jgi:hypothetical protein